MKKTILMMLLAGSSCAVFAQSDTSNRNTGNNSNTGNGTYNNSNTNSTTNGNMNSTTNGYNRTNGYNNTGNNSMNSNTSYNAYGSFSAAPPDYVQSYVLRDYPTATDVKWQQSADWWHGYYMNNGQPMHTYYNTAGQSFTVALPVRQSLVPDAVVSKAISMYGPMLYDITSVKGSNGQDIYMVRTLENGQVTSQWMGEDGSKVIDVYRTDNNDMNTMNGTRNNSNNGTMNNGRTDNNTNGTMNNSSNNSNQNSQMNSTNQSNASGNSTTGDTNADMNNNTSGSTTTGTDTNTNTGKDKLKIKTKSSNGRIQKTKVVNGKVTTKGSQNQNQQY